MKTLLLASTLIFTSFFTIAQIKQTVLKNGIDTTLLTYVNPFIGTGGHGHTHPTATAPFGFVQLGPDTRTEGWDGASGYHYSDDTILGFSHTHLSGTGVSDYCDILFNPFTWPTEKKVDNKIIYEEARYQKHLFSHTNEFASPGYYSVKMNDGISARLTAGARTGFHQYYFPKNSERKFLSIDLNYRDETLSKYIKQLENNIFIGERTSRSWAKEQYIAFYFQLNETPINVIYNEHFGLVLLEFSSQIEMVEVKISLSGTNTNGAQRNFDEILKHTFESMKSQTKKEWVNELMCVKVKNLSQANKDHLVSFYTALYHSYLAPNTFSDLDNQYRGLDGNIHRNNDDRLQYTVFSLWDTYRATHPWFTIFQRRRTEDFIKTFENIFLHSNDLPVWELSANETNCMIGYHAVSVIADAYTKGITNIDVPLLINAAITTAENDEFGKKEFNKKGFIGYKNEPESVSKTLEYAYDSYCIYRFLQLAKNNGWIVDSKWIDEFKKRSFNFINVYDPNTKFMRPRQEGIWYTPFSPEEVNFNYTEANSWQYSTYAPHAIPVLRKLMGGTKDFELWLDQLFTTSSKLSGNHQVDITGLIGQYAHGNEPSHHAAYLYNYTDTPEKTAIYVNQILKSMYSNAPDGLSGNEDCGQMSSWYTFSALGFYPVAPGSTFYDFGRPLFNEVELRFENNHKLSIRAIGNSEKNMFIQSITLNGKPYKKRYISHQDLITARELVFEMGPTPSDVYRTYEVAPSLDSIPSNFVAAPYFLNTSSRFDKSTNIILSSNNDNCKIYYTVDESEPTVKSKLYKKAVKIKKETQIRAVAINQFGQSAVISTTFKPIVTDVQLELNATYHPQYSASGVNALIDGERGTSEYRSGDWQGFYNQTVEGKLVFSKAKKLSVIGVSTLQSIRSWIFAPSKVEITIIFDDGTQQTQLVENIELPTTMDAPNKIITFEVNPVQKAVKSIVFKAFNYGVNPSWHVSPGYKTFIFMDEIYYY